jgi:hypothetical protein
VSISQTKEGDEKENRQRKEMRRRKEGGDKRRRKRERGQQGGSKERGPFQLWRRAQSDHRDPIKESQVKRKVDTIRNAEAGYVDLLPSFFDVDKRCKGFPNDSLSRGVDLGRQMGQKSVATWVI